MTENTNYFEDFELLSITNELLRQMGGIRSICLMTGAHNFKYFEEDNCAVTFWEFKGSKSYNFVKILLKPNDTYKMIIGQKRKVQGIPTLKEKVIEEELYCDNIKKRYEEITGLYLTLFP